MRRALTSAFAWVGADQAALRRASATSCDSDRRRTPSIGEAVERYLYDPYGSVTVLDGDWGTDTDGLSDVAWTYLHQGGQFDAVTGLYHFRHRDYDPNLGRWLQQDPNPAGAYADGMSLYQYVGSQPLTRTDHLGLGPVPIPPPEPPLPPEPPGLPSNMVDDILKECLKQYRPGPPRPPEIPLEPYDPGPYKPPTTPPSPPQPVPRPEPIDVKPYDPNPWQPPKPPPVPWWQRMWQCPIFRFPVLPIIPDFMLNEPTRPGPVMA